MRQLREDSIRPLRRRSLLLAAGVCAVAPVWAQGATWNPTRQIRIVVPYPPGGATDTTARALTDRLAQKLGQSVIVENRPGAGGAIGAEVVYRAAPDGHTILFASADMMTIAPHLFLKLPYKPLEFVPIGSTAGAGVLLVGRPGLEAKTFPEVVELARKREVSFAAWGNGSPGHLGAEMFKHALKLPKVLIVPYQGAAPATQAVMAGDVDLMFMPIPLWLAFQSKVTTLAVAARSRYERYKQVPAMAEFGVPVEIELWQGLFAPPQTPRPVVERLGKALAEVMSDPELRKRLEEMGFIPQLGGNQDEFARMLAPDMARWGEVLRLANVQPQ